MRDDGRRLGAPAAQGVAEVWYLVAWILAEWDGTTWRTVDDRTTLTGITHWRPVQNCGCVSAHSHQPGANQQNGRASARRRQP